MENKEGINKTHQHDRAITSNEEVSKILEISHLIVFNSFSGHAGVSPSSHYRPYCANEPIRRSLVFTSFLVSLFIYLFADLGRKVQHQPWQNNAKMRFDADTSEAETRLKKKFLLAPRNHLQDSDSVCFTHVVSAGLNVTLNGLRLLFDPSLDE